jgi:hypothetical protein
MFVVVTLIAAGDSQRVLSKTSQVGARRHPLAVARGYQGF